MNHVMQRVLVAVLVVLALLTSVRTGVQGMEENHSSSE